MLLYLKVMNMKNNIIKYALVFLTLLQVTLFIARDYIITENEVIATNTDIIHKENLQIYDVINELEGLKGFTVNEITNQNKCYKITGEIKGTKEEIEKMLKSINYFGIISYTINIDQDGIDLKLTLEERLNNNCI